MLNLVICVVVLLIAPLCANFMARSQKLGRYLTWFVSGYIVFAVVTHILPESYLVMGWWAVLVALISAAAFWLLELYFDNDSLNSSLIVLVIATLGLVLHMMLDGAALYEPSLHESLEHFHDGHNHSHMAWAIVLHRLPVGMFLWMALRRHFSKWLSFGVLLVMSLATVIGYLNSHLLLDHVHPEFSFALLQSVVGGALLHCIWHPLHK